MEGKMKKILALALLALLATPAVAKQTCQTGPAKGISHYRLIDGKQCWYKGIRVAKTELEWKRGVAVACPSSRRSSSVAVAPAQQGAGKLGQLVGHTVAPSDPNYISSLNTGVTPDDLAIAVLCGSETSGFYMNFEGRWANVSP